MDIEPVIEEMTSLIDSAATNEGPTPTSIPGLIVHRLSRPRSFGKWRTNGPRLSVIVKGKKVSRIRGQDFCYDRSKYLVLSGETDFVGEVVETELLSFCYEFPAEVVA